jgi:uncharacterized protein YktA (UPF0223 family)
MKKYQQEKIMYLNENQFLDEIECIDCSIEYMKENRLSKMLISYKGWTEIVYYNKLITRTELLNSYRNFRRLYPPKPSKGMIE